MSPKSTVYHFSLDISDLDRGVYEQVKLPTALHPSESLEFMFTRVLAYACELEEGIAFSPGIGAPDEPTIAVRGLDGALKTWVEIGAPLPERLHRASKAARRVAVYCHRSADLVYSQLVEGKIFRGEEIRFYSFGEGLIAGLVAALEKRNELSLSRTEGSLYAQLNGTSVSGELRERRLA